MNTYIALFRGINVGGKNILPMKELVAILEGMGCHAAKTYIQSGNVVFRNTKEQAAAMAGKISRAIFEARGFEPKIIILDATELQAAIEKNPFPTNNGKALHFSFLDAHPENPDLEKLLALKSKSEKFKLDDKVFYLYAPDGIGRSKLAAKVEQYLGVPATGRNWNTVNKLAEMVRKLGETD